MKDTNKNMKKQLTGWQKSYANQMSDQGLSSRMHKKFLPNNKKAKEPNFKNWEGTFWWFIGYEFAC